MIFSVGQHPEGTEKMGLELTHGTYIAAGNTMETSVPGIFAAGDAVTGTKSVIEAIVGGTRAADSVAKYLVNEPIENYVVPQTRDAKIGKLQGFGCLGRIAPTDSETAHCEAERCLQCDLRLDIEPQKFWTDFKRSGDRAL